MRCERLGAMLLAISLPACTLLGAGVGAGVDSLIPGPYEQRAVRNIRLSRGQRVIFARSNGEQVSGRYAGMLAPTVRDPELYVVLDVEGELVRLPVDDVRTVRVEVPGRGWLYGALIGAAIDTTLIVAAAVTLSNSSNYGAWSASNEGGW